MTEIMQLTGEQSPLNGIQSYFVALQKMAAHSYIFAADLKTKKVLVSDNFITDFNFPSRVVDDFDERLASLIYPDDIERYEKGVSKLFVKEEGDDEFDFEYRICRPNGEFNWSVIRGALVGDADGEATIWAGLLMPMDLRLGADRVTGLLGREQFAKAIERELKGSPDASGAVIIIGLDNFNVITESYGHGFGDIALRQIAQNITDVLPPDFPLYKLLKSSSRAYSFACARSETSKTRSVARRRRARRCIRQTRQMT